MIVQQAIFILGTAVLLLSLWLYVLTLLAVPGVTKRERDPRDGQRLAILMFATFCVGIGLVVAAPLEPTILPGAAAFIVLGILVAIWGRRFVER